MLDEQSQEPTTETAVAAEAAPPQEDKALVELQRREKALRIRENKLKQEIETERNKMIADLKAAPLAKLQELGISPEALADHFLNGTATPSETDLTKRELQEIKDQLKAQKQAEQDRMVAEYKQSVLSHVEKDADTYELINNHRDGKKLYWDSVVAYYEEYGEAPDYKEIANKVEKELEEHGRSLLKLKKFSSANEKKIESKAESIAAEVKKEEAKSEKSHPVKKKSAATISNTLTASSAPSNKITIQSSATLPHYSSKLAQLQAEKLAKVLGK